LDVELESHGVDSQKHSIEHFDWERVFVSHLSFVVLFGVDIGATCGVLVFNRPTILYRVLDIAVLSADSIQFGMSPSVHFLALLSSDEVAFFCPFVLRRSKHFLRSIHDASLEN
jgi:hypothetical protein